MEEEQIKNLKATVEVLLDRIAEYKETIYVNEQYIDHLKNAIEKLGGNKNDF